MAAALQMRWLSGRKPDEKHQLTSAVVASGHSMQDLAAAAEVPWFFLLYLHMKRCWMMNVMLYGKLTSCRSEPRSVGCILWKCCLNML